MADGQGLFNKVIVVAVPGLGAGALDDAADTRDRGASTMTHVADYVGGLDLAILNWMGVGHTARVRGVDPAEPAAASWGRLGRVTAGTDPKSALDELIRGASEASVTQGTAVHAVGRAAELMLDVDGVEIHEVREQGAFLDLVGDLAARPGPGLIVAAPVEPAGGVGRSGPVGLARAWARLDAGLGALLDRLPEDAFVFVVGLGGNDATVRAAGGPTREWAPLLAYAPAIPSGVPLGDRASLADVGATACAMLGVAGPHGGASFFDRLIA